MTAMICQSMTSVMPEAPENQYGFTGRGKTRQRCHPESPSGVRDLHLNWHWQLNWHLPFLPSEISNLKFPMAL